MAGAWQPYLAEFHAGRPGITETVLAGARSADGDPYDWLRSALPDRGSVVDLACGSGPLAERVGRRWLGVDRSTEEVDIAAGRAPGRVVVGEASAVPFGDACAHAVVCSLGLMLFEPLEAVLVEVRRLLRPGGRLVALVPATGPLTPRDRLRWGRLLLALRLRRLPFPDTAVLDRAGPVLAAAGLRLDGDERRRFPCRIDGPGAADLFVRSLYLPGTPPSRQPPATAVVGRWAGSELGLPLRRLVASAA